MTISERWSADELKIRVQELTAELEKANQALSTKNELIKLKDKFKAEIAFRYNCILDGINRIFSIVVQDKTEEELGNECLSIALDVTGSRIGFIGLIGDDGLLHDIAISDMGLEQCLMYDKTGHRRPSGNFVVHGLYGSIISNENGFFTNDPPSHPNSIGLPHGHPLLTSFLGVPLVLDGKIKGLLAVSNREGGYNCEQQKDLKVITPAIVQALYRKRLENERELAEKALRFSEEKFAKAFADNPAATALTNLEDGRFLDVNDTWVALNGYSRDEVIGHSARPINIWPTVEVADRFVQELREKGYLHGWEQKFYKKSGDVYIAQLSAKILKVHGKKQIILTLLDITEQKQAEEERSRLLRSIQQEKDILSALINNINDEIWFADTQKKFTFINPAGHREFNIITEANLNVGKLARNLEVYRPDGSLRPVEEAPPRRALRGEIVKNQEEIIRTPCSEELRHRQVNATPMRDPEGNIIGSVSVVRDITEIKTAEKVLLEKESQRKVIEAIEAEWQRFFSILETLPMMICLLTSDYHVTFANRSFREKFGESGGRCCHEYIFGNTKPCEFCEAYNVLKTGQPHHWELNISDGSTIIDVYNFPFTDIDGSPIDP